MKKIIDLIADAGSGKDEKLLNYVRKNYLTKNYMNNLCFINGQEDEQGNHIQMSAEELRKVVFEVNDKNTLYFLKGFWFAIDRESYLKLMEDMCENEIQVFKTDQIKEHITSDEEWINKYCILLNIGDVS